MNRLFFSSSIQQIDVQKDGFSLLDVDEGACDSVIAHSVYHSGRSSHFV